MSSDPTNPWLRAMRSQWAFIAFLFGFVVLLIGICYYYLFPALEAVRNAPPAQQKQLKAWSALILAILLVTLLCGLVLTFRIGRFFFPKPWRPRSRTKYVDVWSEAGKRMEVPEEEETDQD